MVLLNVIMDNFQDFSIPLKMWILKIKLKWKNEVLEVEVNFNKIATHNKKKK